MRWSLASLLESFWRGDRPSRSLLQLFYGGVLLGHCFNVRSCSMQPLVTGPMHGSRSHADYFDAIDLVRASPELWQPSGMLRFANPRWLPTVGGSLPLLTRMGELSFLLAAVHGHAGYRIASFLIWFYHKLYAVALCDQAALFAGHKHVLATHALAILAVLGDDVNSGTARKLVLCVVSSFMFSAGAHKRSALSTFPVRGRRELTMSATL